MQSTSVGGCAATKDKNPSGDRFPTAIASRPAPMSRITADALRLISPDDAVLHAGQLPKSVFPMHFSIFHTATDRNACSAFRAVR